MSHPNVFEHEDDLIRYVFLVNYVYFYNLSFIDSRLNMLYKQTPLIILFMMIKVFCDNSDTIMAIVQR